MMNNRDDFILVNESCVNGCVFKAFVNKETFGIVQATVTECPDDDELWEALRITKFDVYLKIRENGPCTDEQIEGMIAVGDEPYKKAIQEFIAQRSVEEKK